MGKKKKEKKEIGPPPLTEVDKTFFDLQITDIERKIARLTSLASELVDKNATLEEKYKKLDDERGNVISFIKRNLQEKIIEIAELIERLSALQQEKDADAKENVIKYEQLEEEYRISKEQLNAEVKKLTGNLNSILEFRTQRDELYNRCQQKEKLYEDKEIKHKLRLYNIEKKFVLGKDTIKKETEKCIYEMGLEYERNNEKKIAPSTQRVIRENVSVNNEIEMISATNESLENQNEELKKNNIYLKQQIELFIIERDKALNDTYIQRNLIRKLNEQHNKITDKLNMSNMLMQRAKQCERNRIATLQREYALNFKLRKLEQNLHASQHQQELLSHELRTVSDFVKKYRGIIYEAVMNIKSAMKIHSLPEIEYVKTYEGKNLLINLLCLLEQYEDEAMPMKSLTSIQSLAELYAKGDLGFIPLEHDEIRQKVFRTTESEIGKSFEDLLKLYPESYHGEYSFEEASLEESDEIQKISETFESIPIVMSKLNLAVSKQATVVSKVPSTISTESRVEETIKVPSTTETVEAEIEEKEEQEEEEALDKYEIEEMYGEIEEDFNDET